ncbi:hypothetical protein ABTL45_19750, partial [Acinetobacter baumannii]
MAVRRFYSSDAVAKHAISGNIPSNSPLKGMDPDSISAKQFSDLWINKVDGTQGVTPMLSNSNVNLST